jgi:type II secretory pathway component PulF
LNYKYRAIDSSKKKQSGIIAARDKASAISALKGRGLTPLAIKELKEEANKLNAPKPKKANNLLDIEIMEKDIHKIRLKSKTVLSILNQFAVLTKAGIPLTVCMQVLLSQEKDRRAKKILLEIQEDLLSGHTLSDSMSKFRTFNEVTVSVISAGEANGRLDEAFERASKILENEVAIMQKVKSAMGYPIFLLCLTFVVIIILNLVVLPTFVSMFGQFGQELPTLTRIVMSGSDLFLSYWYFFAFILVAGAVSYFYGRKNSRSFQEKTDHFLLRLPLIGGIFQKLYVSRFSRVMASLTGAGVEIIYALTVAARVIPNIYMRQFFNHVLEDVKVGMPISTSMRRYPIFDSLLISMISVGEESGNLPDVLDKMAELYETQTEAQTKLLTTLIEPVMTVIIALVVGIVVISVVMPMFGQYSLML